MDTQKLMQTIGETKKNCNKRFDKRAPGFGLLEAMIVKNMNNERYVRLLAAFAVALDNSDRATAS